MKRTVPIAMLLVCCSSCGSDGGGANGGASGAAGSASTGGAGGTSGSGGTAGETGGTAGTSGSSGVGGSGGSAGASGTAGAAGSAAAAGESGSAGAAGDPIGNMQFVGDFETGDLSVWSFSGNDTTQVVTSPVRSGAFAAFMTVSPDDAVPYRSELTAKNDQGTFHDGQEYWIGLSFQIDDWGAELPSWATIFQTHATPHLLQDGGADWSCNAGKNSITVTTSGDQLGLNVVVDPVQSELPGTAAIATEVWKEPFELGVWYDWVFRYRPSTQADGIVEAWRNGEKIFAQNGANRFALDNCSLPSAPWTYLKVGIYRDKSNTSTQKLAYDEVRVFAGSNGYQAVVPK